MVFHSDSGHGGQTKDLDGDEADGFDEVIYPLDFERNGHIVDDVCFDLRWRIETYLDFYSSCTISW